MNHTATEFVLIPVPPDSVFNSRSLNHIFFLFLRVFCRLCNTAKYPLPSISSRFFWSLFENKLENAQGDYKPSENSKHALSKLLKTTLMYYYVPKTKKMPYTLIRLREEDQTTKIRMLDSSFVIFLYILKFICYYMFLFILLSFLLLTLSSFILFCLCLLL